MPVTLDEVKDHLNLEGVTGEDSYLGMLTIAARRAVELASRRTFSGADASFIGGDLDLGKQAILLTIGTWYENREGATTEARSLPAEIPLSLTWIIDLLRKWDDGSEPILP